MTSKDRLQALIEATRELSPPEQLQLIAAISDALSRQETGSFHLQGAPVNGSTLAGHAEAVHALEDLEATFWPEDESADDFNAYLQQQRDADRTADL